ncbi:MAG: hypothetical protein M1395_08410 [Bacteroidetes bacterium]|nr:hypothetical protein [Bacteroidota bacterium]
MIKLFLLFALFQMPVHYVSDAHLVVYHPASIDTTTAHDYLTLLSGMYSADADKFGLETVGRLGVRLCRSAYDFSNLTGADSSLSPLWRNKELYVIARGSPDDPEFRAALEAGILHGILDQLRINGAPRWLIYAAAVYESGEYEEYTAPPVESVKYFSDLDEKIQEANTPDNLADLYFYLGNTGKFFDLKFGVGAFVKLVKEFRRETSFDAAVKNLFHMTGSQVEREWREFLARQIKSE